MSDWIIPTWSHQVDKTFFGLDREGKKTILYLVQHLAELVEQKKVVTIVDNTREPVIYSCNYKGFQVVFHLLPQSKIPAIREIKH